MKLKAAIKFRFSMTKLTFVIYYGIILALCAAAVIINFMDLENVSFNVSTSISTPITLFCMAVCCFGPEFKMFLQNGISRKTGFLSMLYYSVAASGAMAAVDTLLSYGINAVTDNQFTMYRMIFQLTINNTRSVGLAQQMAEDAVYCFTSYLAATALGYFIASLYYRMNKTVKTIVSIGVPALLLIGVPLLIGLAPELAATLFGGFILTFAGAAIDGAPYFAYLIFMGVSAALFFMAALLGRRAEIKDK